MSVLENVMVGTLKESLISESTNEGTPNIGITWFGEKQRAFLETYH
jgi:hypothetical protein